MAGFRTQTMAQGLGFFFLHLSDLLSLGFNLRWYLSDAAEASSAAKFKPT
jgi:hypothetical protein